MFLLAVKRKFIISLTILMVVLSWGGALVFHTLLPRYYFAWYPSIPIFFYLFGLFYIFMFGCCYRVSPQKMVAVYLVAKVTKMMLSILIMSVYAVAVAHQVHSWLYSSLYSQYNNYRPPLHYARSHDTIRNVYAYHLPT